MWVDYGGVYARGLSADKYGNAYPDQMLQYWTRSFFQRATALFTFENLPANWDVDAFKYGLYRRGFLVGFESKKYGLVIVPATVAGFGLQYQPTHAIINTPYFNFDRPLRLGVECEAIKLTPDFTGIWDVITKYADEMRQIDTAIRQSSINARMAYAMVATDDKSARSLKAIAQKLANGEPAIVYDAKIRKTGDLDPDRLPWQQFDRDLKQNFILPELIEARRAVVDDFYKEIGVRIPDDKRERMITSEVNADEAQTFIRRDVWLKSLEDSLLKFNALLGTEISVRANEPEGGDDYAV